MSLFVAASIVSLAIAACCLLPLQFRAIRGQSKILLFIGTVVLLGFVAFDLIPEMFEMGGVTSIVIMAASWGVFAGIHALQTRGHNHVHVHEHGHEAGHNHSILFLLGSMALHCFSGGMLLVSSYEISSTLAYHVFLGLISHKIFEGISVASLLIDKAPSKKQLVLSVGAYALSFPAGVVVTIWLKNAFAGSLGQEGIETAAMVLTSAAVGSLLGCLLQDFLIPSLGQIRTFAFKG